MLLRRYFKYSKYNLHSPTGDNGCRKRRRIGEPALFIVLKAMCRTVSLSSVIAMILLAGCGRMAENLTRDYAGRRVGAYDVDGGKIAYVWYPAQHISTQGHLVVLDLAAGSEIELEPDLNGPMAMCRGRVVWWNARLRDDEGKSDVTVYDLGRGQRAAIAHAKVQSLDADGDYVVWSESYEGGGSDIILYDLEAGQRHTISSGGQEGGMMHRDPHIGDGMATWEAYDRKTHQSEIALFDPATGKLSGIDVPRARPRLSISANYLVYCLKQGNQQEIHLYDIAVGFDQVVAVLDRLATSPYIEGDKIAWCEHIRKEEFKGIPGQPLMDEKDIRDVFVYDINSGKKRLIAKYLLSTGSRISIHDGRVYLNVYRGNPPPGASNLVVPVDLWVW